MPKKTRMSPEAAKAVRQDLEEVIKKHGQDVVRWCWNKLSSGMRLRSQLEREKARIEKELAKVNAKLK